MLCPRTGYGPWNEVEEPVLAESAASSFLGSLRAAGIAVPEGFALVRSVSVAAEPAPSGQSQPSTLVGRRVGGGSQVSDHDSATACRSSWFDDSVNVGASSSRAAPSALPKPAPSVSFDDVPRVVEDDHLLCLTSLIHPRACTQPCDLCFSFVLLRLQRLRLNHRGPATLRGCLVQF